MKRENGITLIALIITIIILVILAAVSIRSVTNMGIVEQAIRGSEQYSQKAVEENKMFDNTIDIIDTTIKKLNKIQSEKKEITFRIETKEYKGLEGMTWEEWLNDEEYNIDDFMVDDNDGSIWKNYTNYLINGSNKVNIAAKIDTTVTYKWKSTGNNGPNLDLP